MLPTSLLDLSALTTLTVSGSFSAAIIVTAGAGGRVDLHNLTQVLDPNPAANEDLGWRVQRRRRARRCMKVDLAALATFQDNGTFRSDSRLAATNGGTVNAPLLTSLDNVSITITGAASALQISQYTAIIGAAISIDSTARTFTNLTDIDSSTLLVPGAAPRSDLPDVTSYTFGDDVPTLQASGSDSLLDLKRL